MQNWTRARELKGQTVWALVSQGKDLGFHTEWGGGRWRVWGGRVETVGHMGRGRRWVRSG